MSRLDDLLSYQDRPRHRPRRSVPVRLIRTVLVSAILGTIAWVLFRARGIDVPYVLMLTVFLSGGAMVELQRRLKPPPLPEALRDTQLNRPPDRISDSDGMFQAVRRWRSRLDWTVEDVQRFAQAVQPAIAGVVDERLRLVHGVSRSAEPERARALCGPELWTFITVPVTRPVSPNELATVVAQMEAL
jgi:hypothetical protein